MPYGVTGGSATFQSVMNYVLAPFLRKFVVVFIDDILIYSHSWSEHQHIQCVFAALRQHQFKVKLKKCVSAQIELKYLGHTISASGVATDPSKVSIIQNWPTPSTVKDLRSFLGMAGYYRKFVKKFGLLIKPLTNLLKKGVLFTWTSETQDTFDALKHALVTAPVLALPNFAKPFVVETDASDKGVGAVLQQDGHPVAYVSKALSTKSQGLSTHDKECLAILIALDHWRSHLQHSEFILKTDHKSLTHLDAQRVTSPWQQKALTKLMGLNFKLQYKKRS